MVKEKAMKTTHTSTSLLCILAMIVLGLTSASAQSTAAEKQVPSQNVIAISQEGTSFRAPAQLQVGIHALQAASPKFLVGLKNEGEGYTKVTLKDSRGKTIHKPVFCFGKALVVTFDMSGVESGIYTVEVTNQSELYRYQLEIGCEVVPFLEIKPQILAKDN